MYKEVVQTSNCQDMRVCAGVGALISQLIVPGARGKKDLLTPRLAFRPSRAIFANEISTRGAACIQSRASSLVSVRAFGMPALV
jgi:hypothetical protein